MQGTASLVVHPFQEQTGKEAIKNLLKSKNYMLLEIYFSPSYSIELDNKENVGGATVVNRYKLSLDLNFYSILQLKVIRAYYKK